MKILSGNSNRPLAEAIEICAGLPDIDLEDLVGSLTAWFKDWTADGLFASVEVDEEALAALVEAAESEE